MTELREWLTTRAAEDYQLYQRFGKPLEAAHRGEYIAIGLQGDTILGASDVDVLEQAIVRFGSGNFAFQRVGHRTFGQWLSLLQ